MDIRIAFHIAHAHIHMHYDIDSAYGGLCTYMIFILICGIALGRMPVLILDWGGKDPGFCFHIDTTV